MPRIIPADEWTQIKRGLAQRIRALNHFVDDVYHAREIIHDGKVPWQLVVSRPRSPALAHGIRPPGGVYCHVSGCDLVRDGERRLEGARGQRQDPSGISYVLENRRAMTRGCRPRCSSTTAAAGLSIYPAPSRTALEEVAPTGGEEEATVVVWTPGPYNSAYFEHAFLARQMGVELVEALDLVVRDSSATSAPPAACSGCTDPSPDRRRLHGPARVPAGLVLGVPGLMRAYRAGTVAIVNAVGTGVADDKAIYHYVPEMIRYDLGEEPIVANVPTYLMADREQREWVLERLDQAA